MSAQKLYILGHPIAHSKSPVMHNAVYAAYGLLWEYGFMDMPEERDAQAFLDKRDFLALNITTPYKPLAFAAADVKAASAKLAHGANVLVNKEGTLLAYNTDGQGCVAYLEKCGLCLRGSRVVVCGTGPTSLSILHAVVQAGPDDVVLMGRDAQRAHDVMRAYANEYGALVDCTVNMPAAHEHHLSFAEAYKQVNFRYGSYTTSRKAISAADVIIDATPLGMKGGDPCAFDPSLLHARQTVFDVVYGHGETALAAAAREAGCTFYDGAGMLVGQAVVTVEILRDITGAPIDGTSEELFSLMAGAADFDC